MSNVYLDRLRDERTSIKNQGVALSRITEAVGGCMPGGVSAPERAAHYNTGAMLLVVEAITNLADTIQTIHEEGSDHDDG